MNEVKEKWPEIIEHLRVEHELLNVSFKFTMSSMTLLIFL